MDLSRQGRDKVRRLKYRFCAIGKGIVGYPAILKAIRDISFRASITVELDAYEVPPGGPGESARLNREALEKMGFKAQHRA